MVKIAVFPIEAVSHVASMLSVARALSHSAEVSAVRVFGSDALGPVWRRLGAQFVPTPAHHGPQRDGDLAWKSFVRPLDSAGAVVRACVDFQPDVVLYDVFSVFGPLAGRACGVPASALVTMAGYGTLGEGFAQGYDWNRDDIAAANDAYARAFGLDFRAEGMFPVLFPTRDPTLVTALKSLTIEPDPVTQPLLHARLARFRGRMVNICPTPDPDVGEVVEILSRQKGAADLPPRLDARLAEAKRQGKRIVVFSLGTVITGFRFGSPVGGAPSGQLFLRRALDVVGKAVRDRPDVLLVAAVGQHFANDAAAQLPANAVVQAVLPLNALLRRYADAFITHHGQGSQTESILAGVPMISLPGVGDQIANARLLGDHGAAIAYWDLGNPYEHCRPEDMARALRTALDDPSPRAACAALAAEMRSADGAETGARTVVALARRGERP